MKKKVVLITGAGGGIGSAAARVYVKLGYKVVLNDLEQSRLDCIQEELGDNAVNLKGDVSQEEDVKSLINFAIKSFGQIDVLVSNAAVVMNGHIEDISVEDWDKQQAINVRSTFLVNKYALPHLEKTKGNVVIMASVSGMGGDWGLLNYNASKGAIINMVKALALDYGKKGIRVNAVAPGAVNTEMSAGVMNNQKLYDKLVERIALGRIAEPDEVADVITFISSDKARFVHGIILPVDGGLTASNGQPALDELT